MDYKVNDIVSVAVEIFKSGKKKISFSAPSEGSVIKNMDFPIIGIDENMETYKIYVPEDLVSWKVGTFAVLFQGVDKKYLGHNFYDITEAMILGKKKK